MLFWKLIIIKIEALIEAELRRQGKSSNDCRRGELILFCIFAQQMEFCRSAERAVISHPMRRRIQTAEKGGVCGKRDWHACECVVEHHGALGEFFKEWRSCFVSVNRKRIRAKSINCDEQDAL